MNLRSILLISLLYPKPRRAHGEHAFCADRLNIMLCSGRASCNRAIVVSPRRKMLLQPTEQGRELRRHCRIGLVEDDRFMVVLHGDGVAHGIGCETRHRFGGRRRFCGLDQSNQFVSGVLWQTIDIHDPRREPHIDGRRLPSVGSQRDFHRTSDRTRRFHPFCQRLEFGVHRFALVLALVLVSGFNALTALTSVWTWAESAAICPVSAVRLSASLLACTTWPPPAANAVVTRIPTSAQADKTAFCSTPPAPYNAPAFR